MFAYLARTHSDCELWNFWRDDDRHRENREAARTRLRSLIEHVVGVSEAQVRAVWRFIVFVYAPLMLWTRRAKFRAQFAPGAPLVRALAAGYGAGPMPASAQSARADEEARRERALLGAADAEDDDDVRLARGLEWLGGCRRWAVWYIHNGYGENTHFGA